MGCTVLMKVNESLLRSIVTQPWSENYVYARNFDTLGLVRNVVLNKTCRLIATPAQTPTTTTTTLATVTAPTGFPTFNGKYQ